MAKTVLIVPTKAKLALGIAEIREVPYAEYMRPFRKRVRDAERHYETVRESFLRTSDLAALAAARTELRDARRALAEAKPD